MQYLDELRVALEDAAETTDEPREQLVRLVEAFVDYGLAHPAFVDCAQSIMRRPGGDLLEEVSESAMYRLGQAISGCLSVLTRTIEAGAASGDFHVEDPGCWPTCSTPAGSGPSSSAGWPCSSARRHPACPGSAGSPPSRCATTWSPPRSPSRRGSAATAP